MRISHRNQIMSQMRNMNTTLNNLTNSNNRMSSQRKFDHAYEDVAGATKAMRLRKSIRDKDFYMSNIRDARGRINSAEDALQTSVNILRTVTDRVEQALNGTYNDEDRMKIATEVSNLQDEVLALMNSSYTDHFVFDAAGGPVDGEEPFRNMTVKVPSFETVTINKTKDVETIVEQTVYEPQTPLYDKHGNMIEEGVKGETYYLHPYGEQTAELCQQTTTVDDPDYFTAVEKDVPATKKLNLYEIPEGVTVYDGEGNVVQPGGEYTEEDGPFYTTTADDLAANPTDPPTTLDDYQIVPGRDSEFFEPIMETVTRQETENKLDANGERIPLKDDKGNLVLDNDGHQMYVQEGVFDTRETLAYHGMPIDELKYNDETGKIEWYKFDENGVVQFNPDTGKPEFGEIPYNAQNHIDIGLGHKLLGANGDKINPETVFQFTLSGAEIFGMGVSENGMPNNMYSLMGEIVDSLKNNDMDTLGKQFDHLHVIRSTLLTNLTEIGVRTNFLDDMEAIHTNDKLNYQTRQRDVEAIDLAEESMYNKQHEMAWMVTLQLGSKVLPSSLFDFVK